MLCFHENMWLLSGDCPHGLSSVRMASLHGVSPILAESLHSSPRVISQPHSLRTYLGSVPITLKPVGKFFFSCTFFVIYSLVSTAPLFSHKQKRILFLRHTVSHPKLQIFFENPTSLSPLLLPSVSLLLDIPCFERL